ncbi:hypothetical protein [Halotia branconii]|uniref:Uncharacterized protein n=1 Tax=Halotia branconii CENA392 TaxID=1539056 RepID=A0AAJ6NZ32_9CYAN|nr:hypothetical protein [Halotia branconii]WGV29151.1 hypothetical protein QI031_30575 [Halotia branconii CENA392]
MNDLTPEYPFIHVYAQQKVHQPVIIKGNTEGLCVLLNALICALANRDSNGVAEVFCGDAEAFEVIVRLVNTHDELLPIPYQNYNEPK